MKIGKSTQVLVRSVITAPILDGDRCLSHLTDDRKSLFSTRLRVARTTLVAKVTIAMMVSLAIGLAWTVGNAAAQSGFASSPQTNLSPIGPINAPGFPTSRVPPFDPYASAQNSPTYGGANVTPLGQPTAIGPPSYPAGPSFPAGQAFSTGPPVNAATGPNPSYPNGSLLGGLFSGNWFRGNNAGVYQGAAYSGNAYSAPSIYGGAPNESLYGTGPMLSPPSGFSGGGFDGGGSPYPPSAYPQASFPPSAYPSGSPTSLYPGGMYGQGNAALFPGGFFPSGGIGGYQLLHGPRFRHSYIGGGNGPDEIGLNQTDVSIGFAFGNFLYSTRPLYVVPSFSLYLFDGPETTPESQADLPGSAYAGFLDFGWQTDPNQIIGGELGVRVGAYTDFSTFNSDSIRVLGKGLVSFRLTPASTVKAGIYYLDRESIKLLPAGGLLWQPDPYTRFDIFFPEPKLAKYWRTIGTQDVWWYFAGEYGGDSWTITRANKLQERADINQIGVTFGWEWGRSDLIRTGQRRGFIEAGVVFDRELKYEFSNDDRDLNESFMVRAGWGY